MLATVWDGEFPSGSEPIVCNYRNEAHDGPKVVPSLTSRGAAGPNDGATVQRTQGAARGARRPLRRS
jgi:hypothetical protein